MQVCGNHVVRQPESCCGINWIRRKVVSVEGIPRRSIPSPGVVDGVGPGTIGPSVKHGMIVISWNVMVVDDAAIRVATVDIHVGASAVDVSAAHIFISTALKR